MESPYILVLVVKEYTHVGKAVNIRLLPDDEPSGLLTYLTCHNAGTFTYLGDSECMPQFSPDDREYSFPGVVIAVAESEVGGEPFRLQCVRSQFKEPRADSWERTAQSVGRVGGDTSPCETAYKGQALEMHRRSPANRDSPL